jgi:hypothetical protein
MEYRVTLRGQFCAALSANVRTEIPFGRHLRDPKIGRPGISLAYPENGAQHTLGAGDFFCCGSHEGAAAAGFFCKKSPSWFDTDLKS